MTVAYPWPKLDQRTMWLTLWRPILIQIFTGVTLEHCILFLAIHELGLTSYGTITITSRRIFTASEIWHNHIPTVHISSKITPIKVYSIHNQLQTSSVFPSIFAFLSVIRLLFILTKRRKITQAMVSNIHILFKITGFLKLNKCTGMHRFWCRNVYSWALTHKLPSFNITLNMALLMTH